MVVTVPASQQGQDGIRPINVSHDIPQIVGLLRMVFGESLDGEERQVFGEANARADFMLRFDPAAARLANGFVWEADGRIVGNVTLLTTKIYGRYLIANVAVHPSYRQRGIARALMNTATNAVRARNGHAILLQVVKDNAPAINLYRSLGYATVGNVSTWVSGASRLRQLPLERPADIRPLPGRLWREAYQLDTSRVPADLNWPEPLRPDAYQGGLVRRFFDFMAGREIESWATFDERGRLAGLATIWSEAARAHMVSVRVRADYAGELERPLLAKAVRRLAYIPRRIVRVDHPEDDLVMSQQLQEANFAVQRTLTHMRLDLVR